MGISSSAVFARVREFVSVGGDSYPRSRWLTSESAWHVGVLGWPRLREDVANRTRARVDPTSN